MGHWVDGCIYCGGKRHVIRINAVRNTEQGISRLVPQNNLERYTNLYLL